jgi:4-amino-4-deoxy-L-arabinose transferase-like glycosyltransferase
MEVKHISAAPARRRLSLVIPAYNEAAGIRQAVAEADAALAELTLDYEILVVDDGSRDGTSALVAEEAARRPRVRLLRHSVNQGYGAALRTGFTAAQFERVAFTDADCQFHLADLGGLLNLAEEHPVAVGFRINRQDPARRRFLSWAYNTLVRGLLGTRVRDCDCALKVFHKHVVASLVPETSGFFVNTEMLTRARQLGYSVAETGVRHRPRLRGKSTVSLGDVPRTLGALLPFWWSRVLFADVERCAPSGGKCPRGDANRLNWGLLAVIVAAALLFFTKLTCPLQEPQEARYAEIPREMLDQGSWLVPILDGQPYCDKPPLLYWMVMGSYQVFGVHDWAARFVPSLAGFLTVIVTYFWGRRTVGPRAALAGAAILCLSARFIYYSRMLTMDPVLTLWVVSAVATAHLAILGGRSRNTSGPPCCSWRWWMVSALACALGVMTKGPVALVLMGVPVLTVQSIDPRCARPRWSAWIAYGALVFGVAFPWYAAIAVQQGEFTEYFFWRQNVVRFVAPFDHEGPPWYYLPGLLLGLLPWTLLLPGLVRFLGRRSVRAARRRPAALGFFLVTFLWCFLFFSAAGCKRPAYILPALPPLALALGCYVTAIVPDGRWRQATGSLAVRFSALPLRATALALALGIVLTLTAVGMELISLPAGLALAGAALLIGAALTWSARRLRPAQAWWVSGIVSFALLFVGVFVFLPANARKYSLRGQIRPLAAGGESVPVACYPHGWDSVRFYLPRHSIRVYGVEERRHLIEDLQRNPATVLVVKSGRDLDTLLREMPASLEFLPQGRQGLLVIGQVRQREEASSGVFAKRMKDYWRASRRRAGMQSVLPGPVAQGELPSLRWGAEATFSKRERGPF